MFFAVLLALTALPVFTETDAAATMEIVFFGEKAEDAILLTLDGTNILIDAGLNKTGKEIAAYLEERGIGRIDLMLITHFDKDHVGGADKVLESAEIGRIVCPDYPGENKQYEQFVKAAEECGIGPETLCADTDIGFGPLALHIDVPEQNYEDENDMSLVTTVQYGDCALLFAGDAESPRLAELLEDGVDMCGFLKVPHHGRIEKLSPQFIQAVRPKLAVITCSEAEPEDELLVQLLRDAGAEVRLTREGAVRVYCDGKDIRFGE